MLYQIKEAHRKRAKIRVFVTPYYFPYSRTVKATSLFKKWQPCNGLKLSFNWCMAQAQLNHRNLTLQVSEIQR